MAGIIRQHDKLTDRPCKWEMLMAAPDSGVRRFVGRGLSMIQDAVRHGGQLPEGPQFVAQHLKRMRRQETTARMNARSAACREALLRDVEDPAALEPGE